MTTAIVQIGMYTLGLHLLGVRWGEWRKIIGYLIVALAATVQVVFQ